MRTEPLRWRDRVTIGQHELTASAIILAGILDQHSATESDWSRLILALHRLRALAEIPA